MRTLILFALVSIAAAADKYELEKIDISDPATKEDTLKAFIDCLLDKAPCNDIYQSYKDLVPDAVNSACSKCTPDQKKFGRHVLDFLKVKSPKFFEEFQKKYDPDSKLIPPLEVELDKA